MANSLRLYQPMEGNAKRTIQDLLTNLIKLYTKFMLCQGHTLEGFSRNDLEF